MLLCAAHSAVIIPPGGNGSRATYPHVIVGRRPKDLPGDSTGAGTRAHEQSAFDVAGKAAAGIRTDWSTGVA